MTIAQR
nr:photosystem II protein D2 [Solanum aureum]UNZ92664.1 photosystem II protein D2 [Solanum aureum]